MLGAMIVAAVILVLVVRPNRSAEQEPIVAFGTYGWVSRGTPAKVQKPHRFVAIQFLIHDFVESSPLHVIKLQRKGEKSYSWETADETFGIKCEAGEYRFVVFPYDDPPKDKDWASFRVDYPGCVIDVSMNWADDEGERIVVTYNKIQMPAY